MQNIKHEKTLSASGTEFTDGHHWSTAVVLTIALALIDRSSETKTSPSVSSIPELSVKAGTGSAAFVITCVTSSKLDGYRKLATLSLNS